MIDFGYANFKYSMTTYLLDTTQSNPTYPKYEEGSGISTIFPQYIFGNKQNEIQILSPSQIAQEEKGVTDPILILKNISSAEVTSLKNSEGENIGVNSNNIYELEVGSYDITYSIFSYDTTFSKSTDLTYTFSVTKNRYPTKKWTILDVINRVFDLIEPLKYGEKPRFRLKGVIYDNLTGNAIDVEKGSQAEKYGQILSPEFSFTKMNLREQLKQISGFLHAEPRVSKIEVDDNGDEYFEVVFDEYGGIKYSSIKNLKQPITEVLKTDINEYCTNLDSSVDNLVNQIDYAKGVIIEPYQNGAISLRPTTENITLRLTDDGNVIIPTTFPIYSIEKLEWVGYGLLPITTNYDITPYVFEIADYNNLSSYSGTFPYAKAYALYYQQGAKNIKGLFFKQEDAVDTSVFSRYAIINIIRSIIGDADLNLGDISTTLPALSFRITYTPFYSTRVKTNKSIVVGGLPSALAYEQSANIIETKFFGENLKGVIARLGNVEKQLTYILAFISDIPRIGDLYDDNYYISAVSVEFLPTFIKCTIGLSKDFNRLSQYIGINSLKRMWEVSEKQAQDRDSTIQEFILISEKEQSNDTNLCFCGNSIASLLFNGVFKKDNSAVAINSPITGVEVQLLSKQLKELPTKYITLPIMSSAFGNSMVFSFRFEDNYSAGSRINYLGENNGFFKNGIKGWFGNYVPYNDYYGRFYYIKAWFQTNIPQPTAAKLSQDSINLPLGDTISGDTIVSFESTANKNTIIKYRKDNREIPQIMYELTAVTDSENIVIGSALTKNCKLITSNTRSPVLVAFNNRLNVIDSKINNVVRSSGSVTVENGKLLIEGLSITDNSITITNNTNNTFNSWAIVVPLEPQEIQVENEDGVVENQTLYTGGELVLGQNKVLMPNSSVTIYFSVKSNIYDKV